MFAAVGTIMAKLRATPGKPTASTVETVDVLNGSKKDVVASFLRRSELPSSTLEVELPPEFPTRTSPRTRKEPPSSMAEVDVPQEFPTRTSRRTRKEQPPSTPEPELPQEVPTRTSPRKRKEPPTVIEGSSKLRRVTRTNDALVEGLRVGSPTLLQRSRTQPLNVGRRQSVYDHSEAYEERQPAATAPARAPRKPKQLIKRGGKVTFEGVQDIGLPAASPAKGKRSIGESREVAISTRKDPKEASQGFSKGLPPNALAQAAKEVAEASSAELEEPDTSSRRGPGRPRKHLITGRRGRPSKIAAISSDEQPAVDSTMDSQSSVDQPQQSDEKVEGGAGEPASGAEAESSSTSKKETKRSELEEVIANIEDEVSLYDCREEWARVLLYAKKAVEPVTTIKLKDMRAVLSTIKDIRVLYKKIEEDAMADGEIEIAELEIEEETGRLKDLLVKTAANSSEHDIKFVESILIQVIPRMSRLSKTVLVTRFDEKNESITSDYLKEVINFITIALKFQDLADRAEHKPQGLINDQGERLLRLSSNAVSGLKSIRAKYSRIIDNRRRKIELAREAMFRQAETAQEAERAAAIERRRTEEKAAAYARKLQEERDRIAEAARKSQAKRSEEERQWKEGLMTNRSIEAERLRRKFGITYRPAAAVNVISRYDDRVIDIDDFDLVSFDVDQAQRTQLRPSGVNHSRPRPGLRREATEDIPAPVVEPVWTDDQTTALVWGLKAFRGHDRYQDILHAPEVRNILDGKDELDLMQQALYIKQSMAKMLRTGPTSNGISRQDEWSWLRSV